MSDPKRVLILTTQFFPDPWVGGVRMTQFCRFLPEFGWRPIVLTRYYGHEATPEQLSRDVHPEVRVEYLDRPISEGACKQAGCFSLNRKSVAADIARLWCVPDVSVLRWRAFRSQAMKAVERYRPHAILITSPPHSTHDIGLWLAGKTGLPWVADFRDPFLMDPNWRPKGAARLRWPAYRRYERAIFQSASLITCAIPMYGRWARLRYPFARERIVILPNGYPPELASGEVRPDRAFAGRQSVRVVGFAGNEEMMQLGEAISQLIAAGKDVELRIVGTPPASITVLETMLGDRLVVTGAVPHPQALRQIAGADILVSFLSPQNSRLKILSSKLFEFMATGKPILEINPTASDRHLLRELPFAHILQSPDIRTLAHTLSDLLDQGSSTSVSSREALREYDRHILTGRLAAELDRIVEMRRDTCA